MKTKQRKELSIHVGKQGYEYFTKNFPELFAVKNKVNVEPIDEDIIVLPKSEYDGFYNMMKGVKRDVSEEDNKKDVILLRDKK